MSSPKLGEDLYMYLEVPDECGVVGNLRGGVEARVLYQQILGRFGNAISAIGEVGFSTSPRNEEVAALLSGSHGVCVAIEEAHTVYVLTEHPL